MDKIIMLSVLLCVAVVHFPAASNDQEIEACPYGWSYRDGACYRVENVDTPRLEDARQKCSKLDGRLIKITSEEENEYVVELAKKYAPEIGKLWIGLERDCDDDTFYWQDGTNVEYSNWREGQPDNYDGQEDCVTLYLTGDQKGLWNDRSCYSYRESISFMCQKETKCLSGWSYYEGSCYRIENDNEGWRDAVQKCAAMGAQLVKIENKKENDFLASLGNKFSEGRYLWIGMHRDCKRKLRWIDGTTPTYTNWREGQPDYWYYRENCVSMYVASWSGVRGMWNDISCVLPFSRYAAFACEKARTL